MGIPRHPGQYGSQTLIGPCWPDIDEDEIAAAAASFEQLALHVTGVVVPQLHGQMAQLGAVWEGLASTAALGEASTIIGGHESNAALASAIALKLRKMEAVVAKTKTMVNMTATETETACQAAQAMPNGQSLVQSLVMFGRSQNMAHLMEATTELGDSLGLPVNPAVPTPPATLGPVAQAGKAAEQGGDAARQAAGAGGQGGGGPTQMLGQLTSQLGQAPQALGKMFGGGMGLQSLTQPLQSISSMFGQLGKGGAGGAGASPFAAFSNHPVAGGSGPKAGAGLGHGGSVPGSGGSPPRTPLMAKLVDKHTTVVPAAVEPGAVAGSTVTAGAAPVGGGGMGGMGGMGMMGHRESAGGSRAGLAVPAPLDHDLAEGDEDDDW